MVHINIKELPKGPAISYLLLIFAILGFGLMDVASSLIVGFYAIVFCGILGIFPIWKKMTALNAFFFDLLVFLSALFIFYGVLSRHFGIKEISQYIIIGGAPRIIIFVVIIWSSIAFTIHLANNKKHQ